MTAPNVSIVGGAGVSIGASVLSFIATSLPVVQWVAAVVAIVVGIRTLLKLRQ